MSLRTDLKLASFDGGGARCFSQLQIMGALMHQLRWEKYLNEPDKIMRPHEHFDLMGGSETGGLLVIMFVKLHLSVDEAIDELGIIYEMVYADGDMSTAGRSSRLRETLTSLLSRKGIAPTTKLVSSDDEICSGFVIASPVVNVATKVCFRTYPVRTQPSSDITILDAVLATCSSHPYFAPVSFGQGFRKQTYVGPPPGLMNPSREVTVEAQLRFGNEASVASILSLGSGHPGSVSLADFKQNQARIGALQQTLVSSEQRAQEMEDQLCELGFYYRFSVLRGMEAAVEDPSMMTMQTETYLTNSEIVARIGVYTKLLIEGKGLITLDNLARFGGPKPVYKELPNLVPYHIRRDQPRNQILESVRLESTLQKIIVVAGMGGCGKTQLATEVINEYRHPEQSRYIFFVNGSSKSSIEGDIINHVRLVGSNSRANLHEAMNFLQNPANMPLLLVIDNVDDPTLDLAPVLPVCRDTTVLITTRNQSLGLLASHPMHYIRLDVMTEEEARQLVLRCANSKSPSEAEVEAIDKVALRLGYLPVALAQAGHYMAESACSAAQYVGLLDQMLPKLMDIPSSSRQKECAYATFDISHKALSPPLQSLVHLLSFFHFADIPISLFALAAKSNFSDDPAIIVKRGPEFTSATTLLEEIFLSHGPWSDFTLLEIARTLQRYSIISIAVTPDTNLWRLHPLFREWAYDRLEPKRRLIFRDAACRLIASLQDITFIGRYISPHIEALAARTSLGSLHINDILALARILCKMDRKPTCRAFLQPVYESMQSKKDCSDLELAAIALEMGVAWDIEDWSKALEFKDEAVRLREKTSGVDAMDTLRAKREVGYTLTQRWSVAEAIHLLLEVQQGFKARLEANDEDILVTESILAAAYDKGGRWQEAEEIQVPMVERRKADLGPLHYLTLQCIQSLGETYSHSRQLDKAEKMFTMLLETYRRQLGSSHASVTWALDWMAGVYDAQGRYAEAETVRTQHLEAVTAQLGEDHYYTVNAMETLALTLGFQGKYAEALRLQTKVLEHRRVMFGEDQEHTAMAMTTLASTYKELGQSAEAEALFAPVLDWYRKHGKESDVIEVILQLGPIYFDQGRYSDAEIVQREVYDIYMRQHDEVPMGGKIPHDLARTLYKLGRLVEARDMASMAEKIRKDGIGVDDSRYKETAALLELLNAQA